MEIVCHCCNKLGHRSVEYKCKTNQYRKWFLSPQFNENIVFYKCNNFGHIARHCRTKVIKQEKKVNDALLGKSEPKVTPKKKKEMKQFWKEKGKEKDKSNQLVQIDIHAKWKNLWIIDSGLSNHVTSDKDKFTKIENWNGGLVRFCGNSSIN